MGHCRKNKAGLRHAVVCPNVTGRTKERTKASGLVLVRSPLLTSHKRHEVLPSGRLVCRCHDVFLWCYVCFVLLRFRIYAFVEAAALRSIVLRYIYVGAPIATRVFFFLEMSLFSEYLLVPFPFPLCMESTSHVLYCNEIKSKLLLKIQNTLIHVGLPFRKLYDFQHAHFIPIRVKKRGVYY